ncbi:hypothetical protein FPSE_10458 [Fusarium pseudograminearum CS3096]|uniref:Chromo domain-containing protein n=1 Tax=Fusarium pseudograminearum (strain CS3096) TaxID=1028729 RepID=K3V7F3_FUSPC|nr:hypothetical protein FPSE_10458 [Fusarium pseudograminearum CS3096]EKJ69392.1 hypothetical protein FPSE_10458 [Fusarium pseudograminearum CS3096]
MCSMYDPRVYDILSRWSFDPPKDACAPSYPQDQRPVRATASSDDRSQHSESTKSGNNHTYRRYPSAEDELPTFGIDWPEDNTRAVPSGLDVHKPPTTNQATSHDPSTQMWPSPSNNLEVLRVIGYRTIFGRGYDEKNEFWVSWKGYPASEGTWMRESLVQRIAPLQVAEFNHERRLSCHRGVYGEMFIRKSAPCCDGKEESFYTCLSHL